MKGAAARHNLRKDPVGAGAHAEALYDAILSLKTRAECQRFFTDLCTPAELLAFAERWRVARLLSEGKLSYREINAETGVSVTTISRVARFLTQEPHHGYSLALQRTGKRKV